jgi:DNA-binding SARP family transcriptional activator
MVTQWRIELLGGLRAVQADRIVSRFQTQKIGLLLAYLAYSPHRSHPREALIDLLWPECEPQAGRNNLSVSLSWLRRQLEPHGRPAGAVLIADRASIQLSPEATTTDVAEFQAALQAAKQAASVVEQSAFLAQAVELYPGELLPGYFDDWVLQERPWLAQRFFEALGQLLAHLERASEFDRALDYARRGVSADPLREEAHRVHALCSADGQHWFTVGHVEFPTEDPVEVGMHAIGNVNRMIYPGAYPEGTAIRFDTFQTWHCG